MITPLAYAPRPTPLGRCGVLAASFYLGGFVIAAFATSSPIILVADALAVAIAGALAGAGQALRSSLRWSLPLALVVIAGNVIASQRGATILLRGPELPGLGPIDVSAEALAEGAVLALRIAIVIAAFAVHTAVVDPDRLLRLLRPIAARSALTATLIVRLVPLAAADYARLREAASLRGPAARPVGRAALARRLVAGGLDRAVDVAATLELRGYARAHPRTRALSAGTRTRGDVAFALAGVCVAASAIGAAITGTASFDAYPLVAVDAGSATLALAALLPLAAVLPPLLAGAGGRTRRRTVLGSEAQRA